MTPRGIFDPIPPNVRALVGMVACHAVDCCQVKIELTARTVKVEVPTGEGYAAVWNVVTLSSEDAVERLEEIDRAIQAALRRQMRKGGAKC